MEESIEEEEIKINNEVKKKMGYDSKNVEIIEQLESGVITKGVIIKIEDGIVSDFVDKQSIEKWKNKESRCIKLFIEGIYNGKKYTDEPLFTYNLHDDGKTTFTERSNLGKYNAYYKTNPEVGDITQLKTNAKGYFKLVIE